MRKGKTMTRTTTPVLVGLACLMAIPSIAQARFSDGMSLYQYVRSNPVANGDPSGKLTVQPLGNNLDIQCGEQASARWSFVLDGSPPCDGYIVQKVEVRCTVKHCANCPRHSSSEPTFSYWEAWPVKRPGTVGSTAPTIDTFLAVARSRRCGNYSQWGTVKFFCKSTTGDLGTPGHGRLWRTGRKYGRGACQTTPGNLPSTGKEPSWWNGPNVVQGPAYRWGSVFWKCCPGCNVVVADADPK